MGTHRYGISLRVLNSIAREWDDELNTRKEISYLQATMYHVHKHNSLLVTKKSTLSMNENKRINDRWIKIVKCVGAKAQDEKMRWNTTKTNDGRSFQYTKFSVIDLVLTDKRNISDTRAKSAYGKSSSYRFSFSAISNTRNKTIFFTCASAAFLRKSLYNTVVNMIISIINSVYKTELSYFIPLQPHSTIVSVKTCPIIQSDSRLKVAPDPALDRGTFRCWD